MDLNASWKIYLKFRAIAHERHIKSELFRANGDYINSQKLDNQYMEIREAAYKRWDNSVYKIHGKISIRFELNGDCHLGTGEIFYSGGPLFTFPWNLAFRREVLLQLMQFESDSKTV